MFKFFPNKEVCCCFLRDLSLTEKIHHAVARMQNDAGKGCWQPAVELVVGAIVIVVSDLFLSAQLSGQEQKPTAREWINWYL